MNQLKSLVRTTSPDLSTLVSALLIKEHCKIENSDDDALLLTYAKAAYGLVETYTNRSLLTCTWTARFDRLYCHIELPRAPVTAITSIKYYDLDNVQQTLSTSIYTTDLHAEPPRIDLAYDQSYPDTYSRSNAVEILYTAGYATLITMPFELQTAIKMLTSHMFDRRTATTIYTLHDLPMGIRALCLPYRIEKWDY